MSIGAKEGILTNKILHKMNMKLKLAGAVALALTAQNAVAMITPHGVHAQAFDNMVKITNVKTGKECSGIALNGTKVITVASCLEHDGSNLNFEYEVSHAGFTAADNHHPTIAAVGHPDFMWPANGGDAAQEQNIAVLSVEDSQELLFNNSYPLAIGKGTDEKVFVFGYDNHADLGHGTYPLDKGSPLGGTRYGSVAAEIDRSIQKIEDTDFGGAWITKGEYPKHLTTQQGYVANSVELAQDNVIMGLTLERPNDPSSLENYLTAVPLYQKRIGDFIKKNVNGFSYATSAITNPSGETTVRIQSLHDTTAAINPALATQPHGAFVASDTIELSGTCMDIATMEPFETCELNISNNKGIAEYGEINLGNNQILFVNESEKAFYPTFLNKNYRLKSGKVSQSWDGTQPAAPVPSINNGFMPIYTAPVGTLITGQVQKPSSIVPTPSAPSNPATPSNPPAKPAKGGDGGGGSTGALFLGLLAAAFLARRNAKQ